MPRANLTAVSVERLRAPKSGQVEVYDRRLPGFGLRLSYKGSKSWFVMTRLDGRLLRITLGKHPGLSLAAARERARAATRQAAEGKDPRAAIGEAKIALQLERMNTFESCAHEFLEKHASHSLRPSTQREYRRILTGSDTRTWRDRPIAQLSKRDVLNVLEAIDRRGSGGAAKRALVYLRRFFNWCAERDIIANVPSDRIPAPHPEVKRDRVLSQAELREVLLALHDEHTVFGPVIQTLLLTGQRRAEVAGMRWSEVPDLGGDSIWEIPGNRTKNKLSHRVPLAPAVVRVLHAQPRTSDFVFSTSGKTAVSGFGKAKRRIDDRIDKRRKGDGTSAMPRWTLHDLRRTMVTIMNETLSIPPHVVEAVVNHVSGLSKAGVAGVYNRALYLAERRRALEAWADYISRV